MTETKQHAPGYPNLRPGVGRPSKLAEPGFAKIVAELVANGLSREACLAELHNMGFDVKDKDTITRWKRDPRVKSLVTKLIDDRAQEISRTIDAKIAGILSQTGGLSVRDLISIRKEYGGSTVARKEIADENVTAEAIQHMEENPEFVEQLEALLAGGTNE